MIAPRRPAPGKERIVCGTAAGSDTYHIVRYAYRKLLEQVLRLHWHFATLNTHGTRHTHSGQPLQQDFWNLPTQARCHVMWNVWKELPRLHRATLPQLLELRA